MAPSRLLALQLLRVPGAIGVLVTLTGMRLVVARAVADVAWLGPRDVPRSLERTAVEWAAIERRVLARYADSLAPDGDAVRVLGEVVLVLARRGVAVLVVVSPVPHAELARQGLDVRDVIAANVAVLRARVEDAGGVLEDLHDAVEEDGFVDHVGHLSARGIDVVAGRLGRIVRTIVLTRLSQGGRPGKPRVP